MAPKIQTPPHPTSSPAPCVQGLRAGSPDSPLSKPFRTLLLLVPSDSSSPLCQDGSLMSTSLAVDYYLVPVSRNHRWQVRGLCQQALPGPASCSFGAICGLGALVSPALLRLRLGIREASVVLLVAFSPRSLAFEPALR